MLRLVPSDETWGQTGRFRCSAKPRSSKPNRRKPASFEFPCSPGWAAILSVEPIAAASLAPANRRTPPFRADPPVCVLSRIAASSLSASPSARYSRHGSADQRLLHSSIASGAAASDEPQCAAALDQRQASAVLTNPAGTGFRSAYRIADPQVTLVQARKMRNAGKNSSVGHLRRDGVLSNRQLWTSRAWLRDAENWQGSGISLAK
jgi:hypothetical protein